MSCMFYVVTLVNKQVPIVLIINTYVNSIYVLYYYRETPLRFYFEVLNYILEYTLRKCWKKSDLRTKILSKIIINKNAVLIYYSYA